MSPGPERPRDPFPTSRSLEELLMALTGKRPVTKPAKVTAINGTGKLPWFAGLYTADGQEQPEAAIVLDYPVALGCTAAMMETPAAIVLQEQKAGRVNGNLRPALYEILNVCASLLNASGSPHLRLTRVVEWDAQPAAEINALMAADRKLNLEATVAPCPAGRIFVRRTLSQ